MQIEIKPLDTVFFRDAKPFNMGVQTWADSVFPPAPSVFMGVLRTAYLGQTGVSVKQMLEDTKDLKIKGVFLKRNYPLFPIPADLIDFDKNDDGSNKKDNKPTLLNLKQNHLISNYPLPYVLKSNDNRKIKELAGKAFIDDLTLEDYLNAKTIESYIDISECMTDEPKVGIGRDNSTFITEEGKLYRVGMQRMEGEMKGNAPRSSIDDRQLSFIVEYEQLSNFKLGTTTKVGAEGKLASLIEVKEPFNIPVPNFDSTLLKLYFATPAIFEKGWLPNWLSADGTFSKHPEANVEVRLIACALNKQTQIGGFDMELGVPKPMYKVVPAGSIYYLETKSRENTQQLAEVLHAKCIADFGKAKEGFGLCYVGKVNYEINTNS